MLKSKGSTEISFNGNYSIIQQLVEIKQVLHKLGKHKNATYESIIEQAIRDYHSKILKQL